MMQNICKKFLLLLMFSLLRVDMLSAMDLTEKDPFQEGKEKKGERKKGNKFIEKKNLDPNILNLEENSNIPSNGENKYNENFENDSLNSDNTSSNIHFGNDNEYANDPEGKVIYFIKDKEKQEEIKKNNKKKLEVLDILKNVNDHFEEKNKDKEEAIIKNQLTSIDIGKTFEKKIINKNDDVNTIHEVNSILNKRIEKNQELKTLRENQRKKDVNGAIHSYYELRQAQSEIEKDFENERKKELEDKKKIIGINEEVKEMRGIVGKKNMRIRALNIEIEKNKEIIEKITKNKRANDGLNEHRVIKRKNSLKEKGFLEKLKNKKKIYRRNKTWIKIKRKKIFSVTCF